MNIDTLNAYCGNELVSFPYLAQGRLNIRRAESLVFRDEGWTASGRRLRALERTRGLRVYRVEFRDYSTLGPNQSGSAQSAARASRATRLASLADST